jgi:hypothetical protein
LVANPFLGLVGLVAWFAAVRTWVFNETPSLSTIVLCGLGAVLVVRPLFQYHCLDCGRTGRLTRWREHACERVIARYLAGRPRRLRGPTPGVQTFLWILLSLAGAVAVLAGRL